MVRYIKETFRNDGTNHIEIAVDDSSDVKPTGGNIATGSVCIEADSGDLYIYSEKTTSWNKVN